MRGVSFCQLIYHCNLTVDTVNFVPRKNRQAPAALAAGAGHFSPFPHIILPVPPPPSKRQGRQCRFVEPLALYNTKTHQTFCPTIECCFIVSGAATQRDPSDHCSAAFIPLLIVALCLLAHQQDNLGVNSH